MWILEKNDMLFYILLGKNWWENPIPEPVLKWGIEARVYSSIPKWIFFV